MKKLFLLSLITIAVLAANSSCNNKKTNTEQQEKTYSLSLGAMTSMDYLPFVVAQKMGIYDSLGLNLDIVKFYSPNERDAAFQSGNVEGTVIDYTGAAMQQSKGIDLHLIMKLDGYFQMITSKNFTGNNIKDIKGKKIGISSNTVIEYTTDKIVQAAGLSEEDITKAEVNKIPLRMEMLRNEQIDAAVLPDPFITIASFEGMTSLISTQDLGIYITGVMFNGQVVKEKQEAIKLLMQGYDLGVEYINTHDRDAIRSILIEDAGVPENLVNDVILPQYTHAQKPTTEDLQQAIDWLHAKKLIPDNYDGQDLIR